MLVYLLRRPPVPLCEDPPSLNLFKVVYLSLNSEPLVRELLLFFLLGNSCTRTVSLPTYVFLYILHLPKTLYVLL